MSKIRTEVKKITPTIAKRWLEEKNYADNRRISRIKVNDLIRQMKQGLWALNAETIKFDVDEKLLDGQHRLTAVVESGVEIESLVVHGLPTEVFTTIDRGYIRSLAQMLSMSGYGHAAHIGSASTYLWKHLWVGDPGKKCGVISPDEAMAIIEEHSGLKDTVEMYSNGFRKIVTPGFACFFGYLASRAASRKAEDFMERLASGLAVDTKDPVHILRERIMQGRSANRRWKARELWSMFVRAWNAHYKSQTLTVLRLKQRGKEVVVPKMLGLPKDVKPGAKLLAFREEMAQQSDDE